jgi:hypothetical protein
MISTKAVDVLLNPQQCCLLVVEAGVESGSTLFRCRGHFIGGEEAKGIGAVVEGHIDDRLALNRVIANCKTRLEDSSDITIITHHPYALVN